MDAIVSRTGLGLEVISVNDTGAYEIEFVKIQDGGHTAILKLMRNTEFPNNHFLVAEVLGVEKKKVWSFRETNFEGYGVFVTAGERFGIAFTEKGKIGKVMKVITIASLFGEKIDVMTALNLKRSAAEFLDRDYSLSSLEQRVIETLNARQEIERIVAEASAKKQRERDREARVARMLTRGKIDVYTVDGQKRYGIPMTASEWPSASKGVFVVLVESFDDETGEAGKVVEAFQVVKEHGKNPSKGFCKPVTIEPPRATKALESPKPSHSVVVEIDAAPYEVQVYDSMNAIRGARATGLNAGTYVTHVADMSADRATVYAVHSDRIETIGKCPMFK